MPAHLECGFLTGDLIRGGHYGQRPCEPHTKAAHMAVPTRLRRAKSSCQQGAVPHRAQGTDSHDAKRLTLELCPSPERPSRRRFQWSWEHEGKEKAWIDSMYWDCIFMGRLLAAK
jgi:hypothetical protein